MKVHYDGIFKFAVGDKHITFEGDYETNDERIIEKLKSLKFVDLSEADESKQVDKPKQETKPKKTTKRSKRSKKEVNNEDTSK